MTLFPVWARKHQFSAHDRIKRVQQIIQQICQKSLISTEALISGRGRQLVCKTRIQIAVKLVEENRL